MPRFIVRSELAAPLREELAKNSAKLIAVTFQKVHSPPSLSLTLSYHVSFTLLLPSLYSQLFPSIFHPSLTHSFIRLNRLPRLPPPPRSPRVSLPNPLVPLPPSHLPPLLLPLHRYLRNYR